MALIPLRTIFQKNVEMWVFFDVQTLSGWLTAKKAFTSTSYPPTNIEVKFIIRPDLKSARLGL